MLEEDRRAKAHHAEQQRIMRAELDRFNRRTLLIRAREMQEEMAMDMKILDDIAASAKNEAKEAIEKKVSGSLVYCAVFIPTPMQRRLNYEQNVYHQYLRDVKDWQAARDKQVNDYQEAEQQRVRDVSQRLALS